jgi:hypothetical protein
VIVRLMGEGQWRVDDGLRGRLEELDTQTEAALDAKDAKALQAALQAIFDAVQENGERLEDDFLAPSDLVVPPANLTLDEAHELMHGEGLIPDLLQ